MLPRRFRPLLALLLVLCSYGSLAARQANTSTNDNVGHARHRHHYGAKLPTQPATPSRFITSRSSPVALPLPAEEDAFTFAVFGDRTGGPVDGVSVLADAVRDVNLIEPDLVMTVGDLVNGYNARNEWMAQATEFKGIMDELRCPWFPVAGNHDVYWRGPGRPANEHDDDYEMHFGPLWYAFTHKNCWFIALYSDESHPTTGEKDFNKPENHVMSEAQFQWLRETLAKARGARHVFVFLHHPRWIGGANYGDSWDRVHRELVAAGNVTAVFAGHIHRMRYDPRDGIEYVTLATVGGHQEGIVPDVGWAHEFHLVTVRKGRLAFSAIPVGEVMDVREITGDFAREASAQQGAQLVFDTPLRFNTDGGVTATVQLSHTNTTSHPIEITVTPGSADSRWLFQPDHLHARIAAGQVWKAQVQVHRPALPFDPAFRLPLVELDTQILRTGRRYSLAPRTLSWSMDTQTMPLPTVTREQALTLDGKSALAVDAAEATLPQGAFTLETWFRADAFRARTGLVCKTEQSEYGIFVNNGIPHFSVFLGARFLTVHAPAPVPTNRWIHVAGVYDGTEIRLYIDGRRVDAKAASGTRKVNSLPLMIGADVSKKGRPTSGFEGQIDATRLTSRALYTGERFTPERRLGDLPEGTVFHSNFDTTLGNQVWDDRHRRGTGHLEGGARITDAR